MNAYITPPGAQGLELHQDPHDVFVLQVFGHKSWEVHAAPLEPERDPIRAEVASGDAIYIPKGTPHAASTQETLSGHLTVGVHVMAWRDLLATAWKQVERDPSLDESVPAGWTRDPDAIVRELAERLAVAGEGLERVDARALVEGRQVAFLSSRASLLRGALADLLKLDRIEDDTLLERRPGSVCELQARGDRLVVLLGDRRLEMASWVHQAMRRIASEPSFRPRELSAEIPDPPSRLVLARRLVCEGLLRARSCR